VPRAKRGGTSKWLDGFLVFDESENPFQLRIVPKQETEWAAQAKDNQPGQL
jgi:hypothetical protein